ncbi:MAG: phosphoribosyl-ATP diphosphatase [Spirochaetia bacterium]|jgi:phosphoribosyl-ATP pyrophosphohydrolase|nr:phosphoribosyl-ATP diphosphatase [Spirochaetia bacterium]
MKKENSVKKKNEKKTKPERLEGEALPEVAEGEPEDLQPLEEVEELGDVEVAQEGPSSDTAACDEASGTWPLVVCDESGGFLFLASTNRKGYTKSLEQKALWVNHPETDRILPSGKEAQLRHIQERDGYYYAEVVVSGEMGREGSRAAGEKDEARRKEDIPSLEILAELEALIAQRKQNNPEGSYTAYLFQAGLDKIRKKTGEEAIELVLAREKTDIVYEAADLIYHLMVLLGAEGIPLSAILEELKTRK